jgi:hypothetical protein
VYRVSFLLNGTSGVAFQEFETLREATDFANKQLTDSIIEIKQYDNKARDLQNES